MDKGAGSSHKYYNEEEVAALIRMLDREEDYHIFAEDVLKTYPYLAESYTKVCPRRCDLGTAAQKALDGAYSYDVKMTDLKADIALMVSNCVAYNGPTSAYAETAAKFERFALDQLDLFIVEHNGGRRLSRLRLPAATKQQQGQPSQSHAQPTTASASSKKASTADKKSGATAPGVAEKATTANNSSGSGSSSSATAAVVSATSPTFAVPTIREVVQLVDSLNRREDGGAFAVDVAEAYPDLRESYQKMCPHSMDLRRMHQRAKEGYYTSTGSATAAAPPLFGVTVATSLTRLRDDVELLVHNCVTFNANVESWVTLARGFRAFAHHRIDDFVLRHAASLRGTRTGAEAFTSANDQVTSSGADVHATAAPPTTSTNSNSSSMKRNVQKRERPEGKESGSSSAPAMVKVVGEVVPQVCPTALQPSLVIPTRLRRRLALEHLHHATLPLRRVGMTVLATALYPTLPVAANEKAGKDVTQPSPSAASALVTIDAACTAGHVLTQLLASIQHFFSEQRGRPDFADAFAFSQREEQLYLSVLQVIAEQFESTAPHLLLYEQESAELAEWMALRALHNAPTMSAPLRLADQLHYLYLVRFLVQWPQLACLCCTSTTPVARGGAGDGATQGGSLRISRDQLKAMAQVALITQEFLNYVEKFEERVSRCEK